MTEAIDTTVSTPEGVKHAARAAYDRALLLVADGRRARIRMEEAEDDRSLRQNRFMWGLVLKEIAEQARIEGQQWTAAAWHELAKRMFLGYEFKRITIAGRKRKAVSRQLRSTARLSVKRMSDYLDKVMAFAATDLGVVFSETKWERYHGE